MNIFTKFSTKLLALTFSAALLLAGCDNPASNDDEDHDEHLTPYGVEFVSNGETIVTYFKGDTTGHFDVAAEDETALITAEFLNEHGEEIHAEDFGDEYSLSWEIANTDLAEVEQHDEDGRWSFHIVGKTVGETSVKFMLMHGDHPDFETPGLDESNAITVQVQ